MGGKPHSGASAIFLDFVASELKSEKERRATLDQRGIAVITSSGALVTLLSGLAALAALREGNPTPGVATVVVFSSALASFVVAALFDLSTNRSRGYQVVREDHLFRLQEAWDESADDARWLVYGFNVKTLRTLRDGNARKSRLVNYALIAQLIALVFLALSIASSGVDVLTD